MHIDNIIMVGGGSQLPGIVSSFNELGLPVKLGDALQRLAYTKASEPLLKRFNMQLPIAIGLALRSEI